jgi:hypothetical protein
MANEAVKYLAVVSWTNGGTLKGADLRGLFAPGANLSDLNLRGADLSMAKLKGAFMYRVDLRGAKLRDADLNGANLYGANLHHADLTYAQLDGANMPEAKLPRATLHLASLRGANLFRAKLKETKWGDDAIARLAASVALENDPRPMNLFQLEDGSYRINYDYLGWGTVAEVREIAKRKAAMRVYRERELAKEMEDVLDFFEARIARDN